LLGDWFLHVRVKVHGVNKQPIRVVFCKVVDGLAEIQKSLAEIFTSVARNQNQFTGVACYLVDQWFSQSGFPELWFVACKS
jgi:hypothetical protein